MALRAGTRLGPYEILGPLGAGGMGEVYRARDTKLKRDVAIKVLPDEVAADPERRERLAREAQLLAALNHPNIATIHGFEVADGTPFLVLELVAGEDLSARLARGAIPVDEALPIARQLADAIEEAHERGIVHRDLKPANVKLMADGRVKVLDFGIAKACAAAVPGDSTSAVSEATTASHGMTDGQVIGTAAYMSPEQARGKPVDRRTDIWSFGVLLYEMIAGRRPFDGETASDTLAAVLTRDPDWTVLPEATPRNLLMLLADCLVRDPRQRLRDIGDARRLIEKIGGSATETAAPAAPWRGWAAVPWVVAALALAVAGAALWARRREAVPAVPPERLAVELGADATLDVSDEGPAAVLSPDGSLLAFAARGEAGKRPQLFVRRLDQLKATALPGTEGAHGPFFSPDGRSVAFFADGKLKRVAVGGGSAVVLADAPSDRGGTWSDDGTIIFTPSFLPGTGLARVAAAGGKIEILTTPDAALGDVTHRWPQALPGGNAVLFTADRSVDNYEDARIVVQSLPHGPRKEILKGGYHGRYLPSGHVVYVHEGTLFAVPVDIARMETTGPSAAVIDELVGAPNTAGAQFAFSQRGTLVYLSGSSPMVSVQWLDHSGRLSPLGAPPGRYRHLRLSPDGTRLAIQAFDGKGPNIWVYTLGRDTMSRLTFDATRGAFPVWDAGGHGVAYMAARGDHPLNVYWQRADGAGSPQLLTQDGRYRMATSWHASGKYLAVQATTPTTGVDIEIVPVEESGPTSLTAGQPAPFLNGTVNESAASFSPDGRWLAYASDETGRDEIYVRPFPGSGGKWQVSSEGGSYPVWSRNGHELFYESLDLRLMAASYTVQGSSFHADKPRLWSGTRLPPPRGGWTFDLHPDGQRFVVLSEVADAGGKRDHIVLFEGFFDELKRLAPAR